MSELDTQNFKTFSEWNIGDKVMIATKTLETNPADHEFGFIKAFAVNDLGEIILGIDKVDRYNNHPRDAANLGYLSWHHPGNKVRAITKIG